MNEQELAALAKQHGVTPQALLAALSELAERQTKVVSRGDEFWLVRDGYFETTVPKRDASTPEHAFECAHESQLQPWYFVGTRDQHGPFWVKPLTHNEWCDWVRS